MTKVMPCNCPNPHQDKIHGEGKRVHNLTAKENSTGYRCTSCSNVKTNNSSKKK